MKRQEHEVGRPHLSVVMFDAGRPQFVKCDCQTCVASRDPLWSGVGIVLLATGITLFLATIIEVFL